MLIAMAVYDTIENKRTWMTEWTLNSLLETVDWSKHSLIISDNGSCQATQVLYQEFLDIIPNLWVIYNHGNLGTAKAINKAWLHRHPGQHAVKMDNDVVFHQAGWADWLEDVFDRDPSIGICGLKRKDLLEQPSEVGAYKSTLRMLPHEPGQRWLVVEEVKGVMGTCQAFSSALLDKIGYLTQPGVYGFDDALASVRARLAEFKRCFLCGFEIEHIDPGGDAYCKWKIRQADRWLPEFNTEVMLLEMGVKSIYYNGGFDETPQVR